VTGEFFDSFDDASTDDADLFAQEEFTIEAIANDLLSQFGRDFNDVLRTYLESFARGDAKLVEE